MHEAHIKVDEVQYLANSMRPSLVHEAYFIVYESQDLMNMHKADFRVYEANNLMHKAHFIVYKAQDLMQYVCGLFYSL